ncbi:MAG: hypothetical protein M3P49_15465 [Actinomycetota bacterium]|nr:hypothetical protein [Actinomycetota bacterium]
MNHYYCDLGFWRASDQAEVARHITSRARMTGEPDAPRRAGLVRSALLRVLRLAGPVEQPVEREEALIRERCTCGDKEPEYREAVLDDGEWVLRCPECGHLDRLRWLSDGARPLVLGLARRSGRLRLR